MKKLVFFSINYMYLPIILFLLTWLSPLYSIVMVTLCTVAIYFGYCSITDGLEKNSILSETNFYSVILVCGFFVAVGVFFGGGLAFFPQDYDWSKHSAILNDLVNYDWPVVYKNNSLLTYYLGQYLVPGFMGKVFHSTVVAGWSQVVWNALGYTLIFYWLVVLTKADNKKRKLVVLLFFIFFSGATNLGYFLYRLLGHDSLFNSYKWIDMEAFKVHFASNFDVMRGAFQHVILPWMACCLFLIKKENVSTYALIALPVFFSAAFGFVYLAVILIAYTLVEMHRYGRDIFKKLFSKENIFIFIVALVFGVYFIGNVGGNKPDMVGFSVINYSSNAVFYIIFTMVEFGVYLLYLYKNQHNTPIFWIITIVLFLIPFLGLGMYNDLCSRGSIPARFILMVLLINEFWRLDLRKGLSIIAVLFLLSGTINVMTQGAGIVLTAYRTGFNPEVNTRTDFVTLEGMAANPEIRADEAYNYFTLDYNNSLFFKIADKK